MEEKCKLIINKKCNKKGGNKMRKNEGKLVDENGLTEEEFLSQYQ